MVVPGATYVAREGGVTTPPQGDAADATAGSAKIKANVPNSATVANVAFEDTNLPLWSQYIRVQKLEPMRLDFKFIR